MSRKNKNNDAQEPWEQPIYDTESEENHSRSTQRRQKRGNSAFLTIVLILLFLIIAVPTVAGFWVMNRNSQPATIETEQTSSSTLETTSSTVESSTSESETSETTESSSIDEPESSEVENEPTEPETPESEDPIEEPTEPEQNGGEEYATVQAGDGPQQVADRAGITVDELYRLNNIDPNNFMLHPGDQLRVK